MKESIDEIDLVILNLNVFFARFRFISLN